MAYCSRIVLVKQKKNSTETFHVQSTQFLSNHCKKALFLFILYSECISDIYRFYFFVVVFIAILFTLNLSTSRGAYFLYFFTTIKSAFQFLYIFIQIYILYGFMYVKSEQRIGDAFECVFFFTLKSLKHYKRLFTQQGVKYIIFTTYIQGCKVQKDVSEGVENIKA